jgi:hypothetical protein
MVAKGAWEKTMDAILRNRLNIGLGGIGAILGILSLWAGSDATSKWPFASHETLGSWLVAFWVLVPPLYFWIDWVGFCSYMGADDDNRDVAKHTHDLSRNIWLGLIAVLTVLFKISIPLGSH